MIKIFHTRLSPPIPAKRLAEYLEDLPFPLQHKIRRYRKTEDLQRVLLGKLLLRHGLQELCPALADLNLVKYSKTGKAFLQGAPQFNLSYAGEYLLCAFHTEGQIGIDIEQIRPIDLDDYPFLFQGEVFRAIRQAADPAGAFFENWTIREAILKAEGCGATEEAKHIVVKNGEATFKGEQWYYQPVPVASGYLAYFATDFLAKDILIEELRF